ncbi:hypothetical protein WJX72_002904 [[Myrmecia] bisecta]|uniref:Tyrosinase copper-binding domain-containing protein n=1 Tax=[Myrmecia] bisecta TaxID=41462 RepID=A0AAW1PVV6_9CHLO
MRAAFRLLFGCFIQGALAQVVLQIPSESWVRYEIQDLATAPAGSTKNKHLNLFLLALQAMQELPPTDPLSYYQLAGIHGSPNQAWDNAPPPSSPTTNGHQMANYAYCVHYSSMFTIWHRPYILLFEQSLRAQAIRIAANLPRADNWTATAQALRLPFWDWTPPRSPQRPLPPPLLFTTATVAVPDATTGPLGPARVVTIPNPLLSYWPTVRRFKEASKGANAATSKYLEGPLAAAAYKIDWNRLVGAADTWDKFVGIRPGTVNDVSNPRGSQLSVISNGWVGIETSIEAIHDNVHSDVGGDMASTLTSAFDPIFWLHHAQVDRLMARWQASHPHEYVQASTCRQYVTQAAPNTGELTGQPCDGTTTLLPFRQSVNVTSGRVTWHTPNFMRDISKLGYSYPDVSATSATINSGLTDPVSQILNDFKVDDYTGFRWLLHLPNVTLNLIRPQSADVYQGLPAGTAPSGQELPPRNFLSAVQIHAVGATSGLSLDNLDIPMGKPFLTWYRFVADVFGNLMYDSEDAASALAHQFTDALPPRPSVPATVAPELFMQPPAGDLVTDDAAFGYNASWTVNTPALRAAGASPTASASPPSAPPLGTVTH